MSYRVSIQAGTVTRIADGVVVAPTSDDQDPDYLEYRAWLADGNEAEVVNEPEADPPIRIDAFQLREALNQLGLRSTIEDLVATGPQSLKDMWEYKTEYHSDHPEVLALGAAIGKTPGEIRQVFLFAAGIK